VSSGKITELAFRGVVHGSEVENEEDASITLPSGDPAGGEERQRRVERRPLQ
jgi:hypothetical protein